jgi:hypothetical protein
MSGKTGITRDNPDVEPLEFQQPIIRLLHFGSCWVAKFRPPVPLLEMGYAVTYQYALLTNF